jgi:hypothetical protein
VLFDQTTTPPRAIGVEYNEPSGNAEGAQSLRKAHARLLVVVSSGALGSPQILERSGVGRSEVLQKAGIPPVVDLPGVGENYQDHPRVTSSYKTTLLPNQTLDEIAFGRMNLETAFAARDPRLCWNTIGKSRCASKLNFPPSILICPNPLADVLLLMVQTWPERSGPGILRLQQLAKPSTACGKGTGFHSPPSQW